MTRPVALTRRTLLRTGAATAVAAALPVSAASAAPSPDWERDLPRFRGYPSFPQLLARARQLAARHPRRIGQRVLGCSRGGRDIPVLTVGRGRRDVLVLGGPHPNEPVGFLTAVQLLRLAATRPELAEGLDVTWHVVPCMDPDAMVLGQGWYAGPLTVERYHRHFYRPAFAEQVEWTFPAPGATDRSLPETRLMTGLIDELRPAAVVSLHGADFTGAFTFLSRPEPDLVPALEAELAARRLPLHAGLADGGGEPLGRATFLLPGPLPSGASSLHHAARHGALGVVPEVPLWNSRESGDARPSGERFGPLLRIAADDAERDAAALGALVHRAAELVQDTSPLLRAVVETTGGLGEVPAAYRRLAASAVGEREASVAARFSLRTGRYSSPLRATGMLLRAVRDVPGARELTVPLEQRLRKGSAALEFLAGAVAAPRTLVAAQLAVTFASARSLRS